MVKYLIYPIIKCSLDQVPRSIALYLISAFVFLDDGYDDCFPPVGRNTRLQPAAVEEAVKAALGGVCDVLQHERVNLVETPSPLSSASGGLR